MAEESDPHAVFGALKRGAMRDEFEDAEAPSFSMKGSGEEQHSLPTPDQLKNAVSLNVSSRNMMSRIDDPLERNGPLSDPAKRRSLLKTVLATTALVIVLSVALTRIKASDGSSSKFNQRKSRVIDFLSQVSDPTALATSDTPQALAAEWIANTDENYAVPESVYSDLAYRFIQRYVLAVIWYSMGGSDWRQQLFFLSERRECAWAQLFQVGRKTYQVGVTCESDKVTELFMPGMKMKGHLPAEIGWLTNLERLSLFDNEISGVLPYAMKNLSGLKFLAIQSNQISGALPDWIGKLSNLNIVGLNHNKLEGTIPESISELTDLHELALGHNKLTGDIAALESLTELRGLFLGGNGFNAKLHHETLADLHKLQYLDMSDNKFYGKLHAHFLNFKELKYLELWNNTLSGTFPEDVGENTVLEYLTVIDNELEGTIPESVSNLRALKHLNMASNSFSGTMPNFFGSMSSIKYLLLDGNNFQKGPIPESMRDLSGLHALSLEQTGRTGSLEDWVGYFTRMRYLNLARNELKGTVPSSLDQLHELEFLLLQRNELTGTLPEMQELSHLEMFLIDQNSITGSVDGEICNGDGISLESLQLFTSDCAGNEPELICPCCTRCCNDEDESCADFAWVREIDTHWEDYTADAQVFSEQIEFHVQPITRKML